MRLVLEEAGIPIEALDYDVCDETGRYLGTSECAIPRIKVVFEYEGDHHRTLARQWNRDIQKYSDYEEAGWKVVRVTAQLLYRRRAELISIGIRALKARGWRF